MINYDWFTIIIIFSIIAPITGAICLLLLLAFEKEYDFLKNENIRVTLEKELQHSEYMQLNQQIQPPFLFNSMNLLLSLARLKKTSELINSIEHLSMFLKFKYQVNEQLIPYTMEMDYTYHYLVIQETRFGSRLNIDITTNDKVSNALIPPYLLQTIVENAFKHGLEKKIGKLDLKINFDFEEHENKVILIVEDNGLGLKEEFNLEISDGHGLKNIKSRLNLLFDNNATLKLCQKEDGGVKVTVTWPYTLENKGAVE
jgi:two-component system, LytTR family, sensor histidine kinase AlgZ